MTRIVGLFNTTLCLAALLSAFDAGAQSVSQKANDLDALWNYYTYTYIDNGRVMALDEGGITTSEGQSYAMLRAVWSGDRRTFDAVWNWTRRHLERHDHLFSWKWEGRIIDANAATDADSDIALGLLLAANRFDHPAYRESALDIIDSIWRHEVITVDGKPYLTGGNWAPHEPYPTIHVGYLAPYIYEIFARVDDRHPWKDLIDSSYDILNWIYFEKNLPLPPEKVYIDPDSGALHLRHPSRGAEPRFSYDVFPIFWRVAADEQWFGRGRQALRSRMLRVFEQAWSNDPRLFDLYKIDGRAISPFEALPLYATLSSLARVSNSSLAREIEREKLTHLWRKALVGENTPYYLHNWLWFDRALDLRRARSFDEFLPFLYPFDVANFWRHFPAEAMLGFLGLVLVCRFAPPSLLGTARLLALIPGIWLCASYLIWRAENSLNFVEPAGPYISIALLLAEFYCFSTVLLLLLQVGIRPVRQRQLPAESDYQPSVDVLIPIYSESLDILDATLFAAANMTYADKRIHVCDDSHRDEVADLAARYGAAYIRGPRKHAKAGNINNALAKTDGELVLIFDTDHIPVTSFLGETVPLLADPKVGFVQTAHHFYNPDIFQAALRTPASVPDEQDMFHQGIQPARDKWGGAFFVGTGAVFRRQALEQIGGLLLMSITEDIHTSQHLHARGWTSRYVSRKLAVGLNAENLASYLVQRTRWMQGCLQVFFGDNPLFTRGLGWRHRLGYFASQYYFLFPVARVVFYLAPLCFLLFHWHPIFADVSTLLAYLLPFIVCLPIMSQLLVPRWPRLIWGSVYENTIAAALFRSIFDLLLPKKLGFKVTPKGIDSSRSAFDWRSSKFSLIVFAVTLVAVIKGLFEFYYFGIEKDAYFFNLAWAGINLVLLITPLIIAREHPRHPYQNRIRKALPVSVNSLGFQHQGVTFDIDQTGLSLLYRGEAKIPDRLGIRLGDSDSVSLIARLAFYDKDDRGRRRIGMDFIDLTEHQRQWILRKVICDPVTWNEEAIAQTSSNAVMIYHFVLGLLKSIGVPKARRRRQPREPMLWPRQIVIEDKRRSGLIVDQSRLGIAMVSLASLPPGSRGSIVALDRSLPCRVVYCRRYWLFLSRIGIEFLTADCE